jgi:hypothetical protein
LRQLPAGGLLKAERDSDERHHEPDVALPRELEAALEMTQRLVVDVLQLIDPANAPVGDAPAEGVVELVGEAKSLGAMRQRLVELSALGMRQREPAPAGHRGEDLQAAGVTDQIPGEERDALLEIGAGPRLIAGDRMAETERLHRVHSQRHIAQRFARGQRPLGVGARLAMPAHDPVVVAEKARGPCEPVGIS